MTQDRNERNQIVNAGIAIDKVFSDAVGFIGTKRDIEKLKALGFKLKVSDLSQRKFDFPSSDQSFHNYSEVNSALEQIVTKHPNIASRFSIGKSLEGRELQGIRLSGSKKEDTLPTAIFMGCHHAREHLSVEVPLKLAEYLSDKYDSDSRIKDLLDSREVLIVPMINPDEIGRAHV